MTIQTKPTSDSYRDGWEAVFGGKEPAAQETDADFTWRGITFRSYSLPDEPPEYHGDCGGFYVYLCDGMWESRYRKHGATHNGFINLEANGSGRSPNEALWDCFRKLTDSVHERLLTHDAAQACRALLPHLPASPDSHVAVPLWALRELLGEK